MLHHIRQNRFDKLESSTPCGYLSELAPSDYHLFAPMGHALAEQHFGSYEDVKKWLSEWFTVKGEDFYWHSIQKLPER